MDFFKWIYYFSVICVFLFLSAVSNASILQSTVNVKKLQGILEEGLNNKDIGALYFAIKGLKQLNAKIPNVCEVSCLVFDIILYEYYKYK